MALIENTYLTVEPIYRLNIISYGTAPDIYQGSSEFRQNGQTGNQVKYERDVKYNASVNEPWSSIEMAHQGLTANPRFKETIWAEAYTGTKGTIDINTGNSLVYVNTSASSSSPSGFTITCSVSNLSSVISINDRIDPAEYRELKATTYFIWPDDAQDMNGVKLGGTRSTKIETVRQDKGEAYVNPSIGLTITENAGNTSKSMTINSSLSNQSVTLSIGNNYGNYGTTYQYSISSTSVGTNGTITGSITSPLPCNKKDERTITLSLVETLYGDYSTTNGVPIFKLNKTSFTQDEHTPTAWVEWKTDDSNSTVNGNTLTANRIEWQSSVSSAGSISSSISTNVGDFSVSPTMASKTADGPYYFYPIYHIDSTYSIVSPGTITATGSGQFYHERENDPKGNDYCIYSWSVQLTSDPGNDFTYEVTGTDTNNCKITINTNSGTVNGVSLTGPTTETWSSGEYTSEGVTKSITMNGTVSVSGSTTDRGGTGTFSLSCSCTGSNGVAQTTSTTANITRSDSPANTVGTYTFEISSNDWDIDSISGGTCVVRAPWYGNDIDLGTMVFGDTATLSCTFSCGGHSTTSTVDLTLEGIGLQTTYVCSLQSGNPSTTKSVTSGTTYLPNGKWLVRSYYYTNLDYTPKYFEPTITVSSLGEEGVTHISNVTINKSDQVPTTDSNENIRGAYEYTLIGSSSQNISEYSTGKYGFKVTFTSGDQSTSVKYYCNIESGAVTTYYLKDVSGGSWGMSYIQQGSTSWGDDRYIGTIHTYWTNDGGVTKNPVDPNLSINGTGFLANLGINNLYGAPPILTTIDNYKEFEFYVSPSSGSLDWVRNIYVKASTAGNPSSLPAGRYGCNLVMNNGGDDLIKKVVCQIKSSGESSESNEVITITGGVASGGDPKGILWNITKDPIWTILGVAENEMTANARYIGLCVVNGSPLGWFWLSTQSPSDNWANYDEMLAFSSESDHKAIIANKRDITKIGWTVPAKQNLSSSDFIPWSPADNGLFSGITGRITTATIQIETI